MSKRIQRALLFGACLATRAAFAQQPASDATPPVTSQLSAESATDAQALGELHFKKGYALLAEQAWDAALVEFLESKSLYPDVAATMNAANCLHHLYRYDEAVDLYEEVLRDFPSLSPSDRAVATQQIANLSAHVGYVLIKGGVAGSKVVVDGRDRGELSAAPVRVAAGNHVVRLVHEGYTAYEVQVAVAGKQTSTVVATQTGLLQGGRLHVEEASGAAADVIVDGAVVGPAPWEEMLTPGDHVVTLRAPGNQGSQPTAAEVRLDAVTRLTIRLELLRAQLRVRPVPTAATVVIDGVSVGRGSWNGRLRAGPHAVEVRAEGYETNRRRIDVPADRVTSVDVELEEAKASGTVFIEADARYAVAFAWGGDLVESCSGSCNRDLPMGFQIVAHGGYQFGHGFSLLMDVGYLFLNGTIHDRPVTLYPQGLDGNAGIASDTLRLSGVRIGPAAQIHRGRDFVFGARVGLGVLLGQMRDHRVGTASTNTRNDPNTGDTYPAQTYGFDVTETTPANYLYLAPEIQVGYRFAERFEISAGVQLLALISINQPKWADQNPVAPGADYHVGLLRFGRETLAGNVIVVGSPGVAGRMDF
jgi:hypothetical protein